MELFGTEAVVDLFGVSAAVNIIDPYEGLEIRSRRVLLHASLDKRIDPDGHRFALPLPFSCTSSRDKWSDGMMVF